MIVYDIENPPSGQNQLIDLNNYFSKNDSDARFNPADARGPFLYDQTLPDWLSFIE